jgi:hypothetical protein
MSSKSWDEFALDPTRRSSTLFSQSATTRRRKSVRSGPAAHWGLAQLAGAIPATVFSAWLFSPPLQKKLDNIGWIGAEDHVA